MGPPYYQSELSPKLDSVQDSYSVAWPRPTGPHPAPPPARSTAMAQPQTIIITGASDGIGAAAARQLAAQGEHVVLTGRSPAKTAAVAAGLNAPYYVADFADLNQVRELAGTLAAEHPRIDVLANNAG